jgi:hypothetical protein
MKNSGQKPAKPSIVEVRDIIRGYFPRASVAWVRPVRWVQYPTGVEGYLGTVKVTLADGRSTLKSVGNDGFGTWIR